MIGESKGILDNKGMKWIPNLFHKLLFDPSQRVGQLLRFQRKTIDITNNQLFFRIKNLLTKILVFKETDLCNKNTKSTIITYRLKTKTEIITAKGVTLILVKYQFNIMNRIIPNSIEIG